MGTSKERTLDHLAQRWMQEIRNGLEYRKKYSTRAQWDTYRRYYRGQWANGLLPINKTFSYGRMLMPRVYFRAPRVTVTATRPDMVFHAKVVEALDNLLIKELMLKQTMKMSILDTFLCGVGPIKLGYDSEFGFLPSQAHNGETLTQVSRTEEGQKIEYSQQVQPGMPWALRSRPEDVIVPWGAGDASQLPWVAHYILRPLDDVKQDQKYKNTQHLKGTRQPNLEMRDGSPFRPRESQDLGVDYAELFELRDLKSGKMYVFCEDETILADDDLIQQVAGVPWEFVQFNPDPEYFWAIPDAHIIAPQQMELNETNTQEQRHRMIAILKFLYKKGAFKEGALDALFSSQVGVGVEVEPEVENLLGAIQLLQTHIPPDFSAAKQGQINAMREQLGFSQNQEGAFSPYHGKTASESMLVAESFSERNDERKDIVSDTLVSIIRKWNQMIFRLWTEERVVQIITPEGQPSWIQYTGDQLRGHYLLNIDADSGMPITRGLKFQMGQELFRATNGDQLIDQVLLRQILLDQYHSIDPRIPMLLQTQYAGAPQDLSADRQPGPAVGSVGTGKGSGGGRQGMTPDQPIEFEKMKQMMQGR